MICGRTRPHRHDLRPPWQGFSQTLSVADLRKKAPKKPDKGPASLPAKDRRRAEKLAVQIRTLRETKTVLLRKIQDVDTQEKAALRELKSIGQPHLFGV